jgi:hypothetical protein
MPVRNCEKFNSFIFGKLTAERDRNRVSSLQNQYCIRLIFSNDLPRNFPIYFSIFKVYIV